MAGDTSQAEQKTSRRVSFSIRQILGAIVLVAFVVFLVENNHRVTVRLLVPEIRMSLSLGLLIAGVAGALGLLLMQHRRHHK